MRFKNFGLPSDGTGDQNIIQRPGETFLGKGGFKSPNYVARKKGWKVSDLGDAEFRTILLGGLNVNISAGQSLNGALSDLNNVGGGIANLGDGTYTLTSNITVPNSTKIIGSNRDTTVLVMGAYQFIVAGTSTYTAGTIASVGSGGTVVTGSGTSWLANVTSSHQIFIDNRWYKIAAVTGDTTIILAEPYKDAPTFSGTYRAAVVASDIIFENLVLSGSATTAVDLDDCRGVSFRNILFLSNNKAFTCNNYSFMTFDTVEITNSTSNGYELSNGQFGNFYSFGSFGNGGAGGVLNTAIRGGFSLCAHNSNTGDGINMTSVDYYDFKIALIGNGGQGMEMVSGCDFNLLDVQAIANTSDGIKLTATSDSNRLMGIVQGNGGYGINIAASTCDNNVILAPLMGGNTSGDVNDSGTSTVRIQVGPDNIFFGDGSDGDVTISGNTTLTRDMYYNNLTIATAVTLDTANFDVYVMGTLTQQGTGKIQNNGGAGGVGGNATNGSGGGGGAGGSAGSAGAAVAAGTSPAGKAGLAGQVGTTQGANNPGDPGTAGTAGAAVVNSLGITGKTAASSGVGGDGSQGVGGSAQVGAAGGAVTAAKGSLHDPVTASSMALFVAGTFTQFSNNGQNGGTGGAPGGGGNSAAAKFGGCGGGGGGGGAEAGFMGVFAAEIVTVGTNTFFQAKGGAGGNGGNGGNGDTGGNTGGGAGGAGGSGGNGGIICIVYKTLTGTVNTDVTAGAVGSGGTGGSGQGTGTNGTSGASGTAGATGTVFTIQI